jgi:MoaA/NifB/PqqE/SkfB family radical SAM enzyme
MPRREVAAETVRRFIPVLAEYRALTGEPVLISWLGGEPFLWQPLGELSDLALAHGIRLSTTTNGTTLGSAAVRERILRQLSELTISIDAPGEAHDRMRQFSGGFARLRRNVALLARAARDVGSPLVLKANVTLMHQTLPEVPDLCRELAGWGITELTFNQLGGRDRPEFHPDHRLTPEDVALLEHQLPRIRAELAGRLLIHGGDAYLDRIRASSRNEARPVADCGPGRSFLFIDEGGRVAPCAFTADDYGISLASLRTGADVIDLAARFAGMTRQRRSIWCDDCLSTQACAKFEDAA